MSNPFTVQTPEDIPADYAVAIFVNVFTDFFKVPLPGHCFLNGPRGSGKSMMFRYLQPDCQTLATGKKLSELPFYAGYVPIKNTDLKLTELTRLTNQNADVVLNEHFMTMYVTVKFFAGLSLLLENLESNSEVVALTRAFVEKTFYRLLYQSGFQPCEFDLNGCKTVPHLLKHCTELTESVYKALLLYFKRLSFFKDMPTYSGPLCGYLDFLFPLLRALKKLPFMPQGPIFILLDDADNLNHTQTTILNSWVSCRTSAEVSLKISTQLNYKTYRTVTGVSIDTPHDYSEINIATIYTSSRDKYKDRVRKIVELRLKQAHIDVTPENFFPEDLEQERAIKNIADELRTKFPELGRGNRASDDVIRYARPNYIRSLRGASKSGYTYSYAGFDQLVHVSDGLIRYFLEPASLMFSEEQSLDGAAKVVQVRPGIQHQVVFKQAELLMFNEFEKLKQQPSADPSHLKHVQKLGNIIHALGGTFRQILLSNRSERKVFSIAFSNPPDEDVSAVLRLGVKYGYFHESTIGNKEGTGRTRLYVLTRRLAPLFTLDVTGFAGYLFVTNESMRLAMVDPDRLLRQLKPDNLDAFFSSSQMDMFPTLQL